MSVHHLAAAAWLWPHKTISIHDLYLFRADRYKARDGQQHFWASGVFGMFGIYRRQVSAAGGVHTLLSFVLYCIIYATRPVQHLEASLEESMSVRNSKDTTHFNAHSLLRILLYRIRAYRNSPKLKTRLK
jgi:hypothetical protein